MNDIDYGVKYDVTVVCTQAHTQQEIDEYHEDDVVYDYFQSRNENIWEWFHEVCKKAVHEKFLEIKEI